MHTTCIYEYGIYNESAWCALFPEDKAQVLEYYEDLEYYWEDAYGHNISHDQACVLINDIYEHFTWVIDLLFLFKYDKPYKIRRYNKSGVMFITY